MPFTNTVVLNKNYSYEDSAEGGYDYRYPVISCDVDPKIGTLYYSRRSFPGLSWVDKPCPPPTPSSFAQHVSMMDSLLDVEIKELTDEYGIIFIYQ